MKSEELLHRVTRKEHSTNSNKKANWISHILHRTYLLNHVVEGKIDRSDGKMRMEK